MPPGKSRRGLTAGEPGTDGKIDQGEDKKIEDQKRREYGDGPAEYRFSLIQPFPQRFSLFLCDRGYDGPDAVHGNLRGAPGTRLSFSIRAFPCSPVDQLVCIGNFPDDRRLERLQSPASAGIIRRAASKVAHPPAQAINRNPKRKNVAEG